MTHIEQQFLDHVEHLLSDGEFTDEVEDLYRPEIFVHMCNTYREHYHHLYLTDKATLCLLEMNYLYV